MPGSPVSFMIPFIVVGLALMVILAIYGARRERQRVEAFTAFASSKGFRYAPGRDRGIVRGLQACSDLRQGGNRYASHILRGTWRDRPFSGFELHYETKSSNSKGGSTTHHHYLTVAVVEAPFPLDPLRMRPEGFFDKITAAFGHDDIDFESAEFSRRFHVTSPHRKWAYDVLHVRAIEFLLELDSFSLEFLDRRAVVIRKGRPDPGDLVSAADVACGLLDLLPDYVVADRKGRGA